MNARVMMLAAAFLVTATFACAQGFAGLGTQAEGFALPRRGVALEFPADHGPHPAFRIEWWYLTATLTGADGRDYGAQWTLFRSALKPEDGSGWRTPQLWMGHAAITTPERHLFAERLARGGIGVAGVEASPFHAWIDDWQMTGRAGSGMDELTVTARGADFAYRLKLHADGPLVLHGEGGYSVKSPGGQASYYYSQPAYDVTGVLDLPGGPVEVSGNAWLDREWSSQPLAADQSGWDWFSLSFESGARMMGFRLRDGGAGFTSATWIDPDGHAESLSDGALHLTALERADVAGRQVPVAWRVTLPAHGLDVTVRALNPQSWMGTRFPYWEGPVGVSGSHAGRGYLEMTGYE